MNYGLGKLSPSVGGDGNRPAYLRP